MRVCSVKWRLKFAVEVHRRLPIFGVLIFVNRKRLDYFFQKVEELVADFLRSQDGERFSTGTHLTPFSYDKNRCQSSQFLIN